MPFLIQGKTNWKFLLIIIVLAMVVLGVVTNFEKIRYAIELIKIHYATNEAMEETQRRRNEAPTVFEKLPIPEDWVFYEQGYWKIAYPSDFEIKNLITSPDFPNEKVLLFRGEFDGRNYGITIRSGFISDIVEGNLIEVAKREGGFGNLDAILFVQRMGVGRSPEEEPPKILRDGKVLVGNLLGAEFLTQGYDGLFMLKTTFEKDSRVVDITTSPESIESNDSLMEIYNTMISSFKFIEDETADWQTYSYDEYGFSVDLPQGWELTEKEEGIFQGELTRMIFSFTPPECISSDPSCFWGYFIMDVYPYQASPGEWVAEYLPDYKDKLEIEEIESLGEKPTFLLTSASEDVFFSSRSLVLGNKYSYVYGFGQDLASNFVQRIEGEIFPHINIK